MITKAEALNRVRDAKAKMVDGCEECGGDYVEHGCGCIDRHRKESLAILARIPDEYLGYSLDSYPGCNGLGDVDIQRTERVKKFIQGYVDKINENVEKNIGLAFIGPYGSGKTFLSTYCAREAMYAAFPRIINNSYCTMNDILLAYGAGGNLDTRIPNHEQEDFEKGILIIDDLGKEFVSGWKGVDVDAKSFGLILDNILRRRQEEGLLTFISSNLTMGQIGARYGKSVVEAMKMLMYELTFSNNFPNLRDFSTNSAKSKMKKVEF